MTDYALVSPQGEIRQVLSAERCDPTVPTKAGWRWLPVIDEAQPSVTPLQSATRSDVVQGNQVIRGWTITTRAPVAADVKQEAQRRIVALVGAFSFEDCIVKQLNASMRANELNDIRHDRALTDAEAAEAAALRALAAAIKAIRTKSNEIEAMNPIPADFTENSRWS